MASEPSAMSYPFRLLRILVIAAALLGTAEGAVRLVEARLAAPSLWYTPSLEERHAWLSSQAHRTLAPEVLFVGSSIIGYGVDTDLFGSLSGCRSANLGISAADTLVTEAWLRDFVLPASAGVRYVVLGVTSLEFNANAIDRGIDRWRTQLATRPGWRAELQRWAFPRFRLVSQRENLSNPLRLASMLWHGARPDPRRGLPIMDWPLPRSGRDPVHRDRVLRERFLYDFEEDPASLLAIARMDEMVREAGARLVVVFMPVAEGYREAHPGGVDEFDGVGRSVARVVGDGPFLDLSRALPANAFFDHHHANRQGADALTRLLVDALGARRWCQGQPP
jgi:hypothetical protein